jgi:tetratricopeptide (TPR) repeat protein
VRRLTLLFVLLLLVAAPVAAQQEEPPPEDPVAAALEAAEAARDAADRAEAALEEIAEVREQADSAVDLANSMFTFFEVMSAVVGIVLPVLVVIAGLLGFRRLEQANQELRQARERFEKEMDERRQELDQVREDLQDTARTQRERATASSIALSLLPVGERQYRAQDYSGALDTYRRALEFDELNPIIHYRLGYVYSQSGELDRSRHHLERALELDPQFVPSKAALGYVFRRQGDAIQKEIERLIQSGADPDSQEITQKSIERDKVYIRSEDYFVDALGALRKLMDEDGESWWGALGGLYRRRGQTQQAIDAYKRAAEVTPQSSYPVTNLALLYAETGKLDDMKKAYHRVEQLAYNEVQADVDNYWAYADLVVSRLAQGKVKETWDVLETTLATAPPDSPYTLEMLIDTLERLSKYLDHARGEEIDKVIAHVRQFMSERDERRQTSEQVIADFTSDDA